MPYGLYISAAGAEAQSERLQVISNNLANVSTAGFKREIAVLQAKHSEAVNQNLDYPGNRGVNDLGGGVFVSETVTDHGAGPLNNTGVPSDLAIQGEGFFRVRDNQDNEFLTRAGNFNFDRNGLLRTQSGHLVLSESGGPVAINPDSTEPWSFNTAGMLQQGDAQTPLAVVQPQSLGDLVKVGDNLFSPLADNLTSIPFVQRNVRQGYLEMSSVKPAAELMEMMTTSRAYEANVNLIRNQDELTGQLLNRVLRS